MKIKSVTKTLKVVFDPSIKIRTDFYQEGYSIKWYNGIKWYNNIWWWHNLTFHLKSKKVVNNG